jgi:uncharacterized protein
VVSAASAGVAVRPPDLRGFWYLDASAVVKLVIPEPDADRFRAWLAGLGANGERCAVSDLVRTEVVRTVQRRAPRFRPLATSVAEAFAHLALSSDTYDAASDVGPPGLRTLDALHLATALQLGPALVGIVTYDRRLAVAAATHGIVTIAP